MQGLGASISPAVFKMGELDYLLPDWAKVASADDLQLISAVEKLITSEKLMLKVRCHGSHRSRRSHHRRKVRCPGRSLGDGAEVGEG